MPEVLKFYMILVFIFLCVELSPAQGKGQSVVESVPAFRFQVDENVTVDVKLHQTKESIPIYYSAHLERDVCEDMLCRPVNITIRWDLIGRFLSYHTEKMYPLTKFDHVMLTAEDHARLHQILSDTTSILRDYEVEDMIDNTVQLYSSQVDAVTRATNVIFDGTTVEGALYTVYTLWHFTNGPIREKIKKSTISLVDNDAVLRYLLTSEDRDYVSFAFKNMSRNQYHRFEADIVGLVGSKDTYIPHFALAELDDNVLALPKYQHHLVTYFQQGDNQLKNALLDRFSSVPMDAKLMITFLSSLSGLQEDQVRKAFAIIENNKSRVNTNVREKLLELSRGRDRIIARQAGATLRKIN